MCHPGHPDAELAGLDPVVDRRRMEYDALMRDPDLPAAHLAAFAQRRRTADRLVGAARLSMTSEGNRSAPGAQHPVRHGLAFLVSGGTAFTVDALVLKLLTAVFGLHPIRRPAGGDRRWPWWRAG